MFTNRPAIKNEIPIHEQKDQAEFSKLKDEFILIRDAVQKNLLTDNNTSIDSDRLWSNMILKIRLI